MTYAGAMDSPIRCDNGLPTQEVLAKPPPGLLPWGKPKPVKIGRVKSILVERPLLLYKDRDETGDFAQIVNVNQYGEEYPTREGLEISVSYQNLLRAYEQQTREINWLFKQLQSLTGDEKFMQLVKAHNQFWAERRKESMFATERGLTEQRGGN